METLSIENEQEIVDNYHLSKVEKAVTERIDQMDCFGDIDCREGMKQTSKILEEKFKYWLLGVHNKVPAEFQEIKNKGY